MNQIQIKQEMLQELSKFRKIDIPGLTTTTTRWAPHFRVGSKIFNKLITK